MSSGALGKAISNIHIDVEKSLKYITEPSKTEGQLLVSGINCYEPENFKKTNEDFKKVRDKFLKNQFNKKQILAHHYLVSFDPVDNIEPQKAHQLANEIINRFLKKEYQAVLSTHVDKKNHIHTHMIFNSYNKNNGKKYESSPAKLREFKKIINDVCLEHDLNLINKPKFGEKRVSLNYKEWLNKNNINDDKNTERFKYIRHAIKAILKDNSINTLEKLSKALLQQYNLNIRYKNYKTNKLYKNITFKSDEWEKGVRGKHDISLENIIARLEGREIKSNKFEEYCFENDTVDYKGYIKKAIDTELKNNISINDVKDLAEVLKRKYNIEMNFLSTSGYYLKRFKFKALDSRQTNFISSASLDKENRDNYELKGIKERISRIQEVKFGIDIRENLKILNKNLLISGYDDKYGIRSGLNYMTKRNLRLDSDMDIRRTKIAALRNKNEIEIDKIDKYIQEMELIYTKIKKKTIEIKSLDNEISELGIFKMKRKKELMKSTNDIKTDIEKLKETEFYQKEIKYSEKIEELTNEKDSYISQLREYDNESDLLYNIQTINKNKEKILESLKLEHEHEKEEQEQKKERNFKKSLGIEL